MISATGKILCEIPPEVRADLLKGAIRLTGSVLRDTKSGRIIGFLQEAAPVGRFLGQTAGIIGGAALGGPTLLAGMAATAGLQVAGLVQGEATRRGVKRTEAAVQRVDGKVDLLGEKMDDLGLGLARVEDQLGTMQHDLGTIGEGVRALQAMGFANMALGAAGLGVSVIGFGVMAARLGQVQASIHALADSIASVDDKLDRLQQHPIETDFSNLFSLTGLYEECWGFLDTARAEQQWHRIQQDALSIQNRFARRAQELLQFSPAGIEAADSMLDAVALANGVRVASLFACNEGGLAARVANEGLRQIEGLTGSIGLVDLVGLKGLAGAEPGTPGYEIAQTAAREEARPLLRKLRAREVAVATRAAPLATLEQRDIKPRAWLEAARNEQEAPVLFLSA